MRIGDRPSFTIVPFKSAGPVSGAGSAEVPDHLPRLSIAPGPPDRSAGLRTTREAAARTSL